MRIEKSNVTVRVFIKSNTQYANFSFLENLNEKNILKKYIGKMRIAY